MNDIVRPGEWPAWIRYTLSAGAGVLVTVVTMTQAFSGVSYRADSAHERSIENAARIKALELRASAKDASDMEWKKNVLEALKRIELKVDGK